MYSRSAEGREAEENGGADEVYLRIQRGGSDTEGEGPASSSLGQRQLCDATAD